MHTLIPVIDRFDGNYDFLSNFFKHPLSWNRLVWPTAEHAYQFSKAYKNVDEVDFEFLKYWLNLTPGQAKRAGAKLPLRSDWEEIKVDIMESILFAKFEVPILAKMLTSTEPAHLIEGNNWGDTFWGEADGKGENILGKLLMKVRKHKLLTT